jgi:competence protein ComEA
LWKIVFGVLCGLAAAGLILLTVSRPRGPAVELLPPDTPKPVVIYVDGAVVQPGLYTLPAGARVGSAIDAAGGFLGVADTHSLNLAASLVDGERLLVPTAVAAQTPVVQDAPRSSDLVVPAISYPININTASQAELESLPGIGPALAQAIIEYRQAHGPFKTIEEIIDVSGIGPKTFEKIKALITV